MNERRTWAEIARAALLRRAALNAPLGGHPVATEAYPPEGKPLAEGWGGDAERAIERRRRLNG